jgi:hypothetical protein
VKLPAAGVSSSGPGESCPRFFGQTYKLEATLAGVRRDWPLHPAAARALTVQRRLVEAAGGKGQEYLWVLVYLGKKGRIGAPLLDLNAPIAKAVNHLGLGDLLDNTLPHVHRWRHTVARHVALSVVGAPQVLMDLFGHRDLEMTLQYMLSHPEIAQEALRVAKEASLALAEEAITSAVEGSTGGNAGRSLHNGLVKLQMRKGTDEFGTSSLGELATVLTAAGREWLLVRPGVICTKSAAQFGPCTKERGTPDPGNCQSDCRNRLELPRAKAQCNDTVAALLRELSCAKADGLAMVVANLSGQLIAQLKRWPEIRERWLSNSALARSVWEDRES